MPEQILAQNVLFFDKRIKNLYADTSEVIAYDQKTVVVDAFVKYRIVDALKFYQAAKNEDNFKKRLDSILGSSLRQVLGSVPFKTLLSEERSAVMHRIRDIVNEESGSFGVEVLDVRISRANLPDKSREAVYDMMKADRAQEARKIRAEGDAEAKRITSLADKQSVITVAQARQDAARMQGEGEAEAMRILNKAAAQDLEFYNFYRSMEVYKQTIDPNSTVMILSPDNKFLQGMSN